MSLTYSLHPNATKALAQWHEMILENRFDMLSSLLHADVCFRSPVAFTPYQGVEVVSLILTQVGLLFVNFAYHRQFISQDEHSVVLEFSATVNEKQIKGIDMIKYDDDGKVIELEVMVRPMTGLMAVAEQMKARLAPYLTK